MSPVVVGLEHAANLLKDNTMKAKNWVMGMAYVKKRENF